MKSVFSRLLIVALLSFFGHSQGYAYGPCDQDVQKLCTGAFHQETERTCLHKKIEELSAECKSYVKSKEVEWKRSMDSWDAVKIACSKDIDQECAEVKAKAEEAIKALQVCLMTVSEKLSAPCKKDVNRHIKEFQPNIREIE